MWILILSIVGCLGYQIYHARTEHPSQRVHPVGIALFVVPWLSGVLFICSLALDFIRRS